MRYSCAALPIDVPRTFYRGTGYGDRHRHRSRAPPLPISSTNSHATVLFLSLSFSPTHLYLFFSLPVPTIFTPRFPYSPPHERTQHAPTTMYTIFTCRSNSCETIDIGLTRSPRNHPLRQSTSPNRSLSGLEET